MKGQQYIPFWEGHSFEGAGRRKEGAQWMAQCNVGGAPVLQ